MLKKKQLQAASSVFRPSDRGNIPAQSCTESPVKMKLLWVLPVGSRSEDFVFDLLVMALSTSEAPTFSSYIYL